MTESRLPVAGLRHPLRAAKVAHLLITLAVVLAIGIFAYLDRLSDAVEEMDRLVGQRTAIWREISSYSEYLLKSGSSLKTPSRLVENLQGRLREKQAEDERLREALAKTASEARWLNELFPEDMAHLRGADISSSVQRFVKELYSTPSTLLEARVAELAPAEAIEILSGRALDPLNQRVLALRDIRAKLAAFRSPIEWMVAALVLLAIWGIWFLILKPSIVRSLDLQRKIKSDERRARITLASIGDAVLVVDSNGRIETFNPAAEDLFKANAAQAIGLPLSRVLELRATDSTTGAAVPTRRRTEIIRRMPSGSDQVRVVDLTAAPIAYRGEAEQGQVLILHDVTLEQKLHEQRHINDKARAVVGLAGGLAHEFNNALAIISGAMELTRIKLAKVGDPFKLVERHLTAIENAVRQSRGLTTQLLAIGSELKLKMSTISVLAPLTEAVAMIEQSTDRSINIVLDVALSGDEKYIDADASALQRAFVNLGFNSVDAISGAGRISIRVTSIAGDDPDVRIHQIKLPAKSFVRIDWADTGAGIAEADLSSVFEPFFTTKTMKGSSGLGLSIVRGIINGHGGAISVASEPGSGAVFTILLPQVQVPAEEQQPALPPDKSPVVADGSPLCILVAEDERAFADWLDEVLRSNGHEVIMAADGVEALDLYRSNRERIGLTILDLNMPNKNGYEVEAVIRAAAPHSRIIASTGDLSPLVGGEGGLSEATIVLKKPYGIDDLLGAIARISAVSPR